MSGGRLQRRNYTEKSLIYDLLVYYTYWFRVAGGIGNGNLLVCTRKVLLQGALCGLRGCKNRPAPFPGRMSYKVTKPGSVCPVS